MGLLTVGSFFVSEFFDRDLPAFSHLPNSLRAWDVNLAVGASLLLLVLAVGFLAYRRSVPERLARELLSRKAFSPEAARSLSELSITPSLLLRFSLHDRASGLRRCVRVVGEEPIDVKKRSRKEKKAARKADLEAHSGSRFAALKARLFPNLSDARFYLDPSRAEEAEKRYAEGNRVTLRTFGWTAAACTVLFFVLCRLMPSILLLIDTLLG